MKLRTLSDVKELKGKKILLRVDFNVPINDKGEVEDDTRIVEALPTIKYLQEKGAKTIIISHLGRPDGEIKEEMRLTPIAKYLSNLLNQEVKKSSVVLGEETTQMANNLQEGEILILENVRFRQEEEQCEENFTKELSSLGEIFVNDAFGTAHRKHASTAGVADYLPAYAGLLMEREITHLLPLTTQTPQKPLTVIFGGAKIDTKIGIIKHFMDKADYFLIGGALANTFLAAKGLNIGKSLYEKDKLNVAKEIIEEAKEKLILPTDVITSKEISDQAITRTTLVEGIQDEEMILDIGPSSSQNFCYIISKSKTVIWNGPLGLCENKPFQEGTRVVAKHLSETNCISILGGGDTTDALKKVGVSAEKFTHVSTGGGACIEFLSGENLPGIDVLLEK